MSKWVQMFTHISGGRGDGTEWPDAGGKIELDDDEARQVVAGRLGRYAPEDDVEARPAPDDAEKRPARLRRAGKPAEA